MKQKTYAYKLGDVMQNNVQQAWDPEQLWKYATRKKITNYQMHDVKHWVYKPCWSEGKCYISIFQVLKQRNFPEHQKRIEDADLKHALIVTEDEYDKYGTIIDGHHRFAKMILQNETVVPVVFFTENEMNRLKIEME